MAHQHALSDPALVRAVRRVGQVGGSHVMWWVYVLQSSKNGRLYTGSTNDLERRLAEHKRGKTRYTRHAGPFSLVHSEEHPTRLDARRRERVLKSGRGREELARLLAAQ